MRKLITLALCAVMLASLFAVSSSAAGEILFQDDFSDGFTNPNNWYLEGNLYFGDDMSEPGNPCLSAYADGVVSQMEYRYDHSSTPRLYATFAVSIDIRLRDFDRDGDHWAGFWWRENFLYTPDGEDNGGHELGPVYFCCVNFDDSILYIRRDDTEGNLIEIPVTGISADDGWFNLGWRVVPGKMECFLNGEKMGEILDEGLFCELPSPILLWNSNNFISYDNMVISTPDYDLFNEGLDNVDTTASTDAPVVDDTTADTDAPVVDDTNADTDAPAVDDTNAPADDTNAPADDTNAPADDPADTVGTTDTQKPSTSTGDAMALVVVAMIVALGTAVVVKKAQAE